MPDTNATLTSSDTTHRPAKGSSGRSTAVWATLALAVIVLAALLVFVGQNSQHVEIHYLGANTSIGFGVALLLAAAAGVVFAALVGIVLRIRRSLRS